MIATNHLSLISRCSRERSAIDNAAPQRHLIGILQFIAHRDTTGNDRELHIQLLQFAIDIEIRRVPLHRGTQGENDFVDTAFGNPFDQAFDLQVTGTDTIHRRNDSAQHMIQSTKLLRSFHCHHVPDVLHHTNHGRIALRIGADAASLCIRNIVTYLAILYLVLQRDNGIAERIHRRHILPKQMQHQPHRRLTPYSGQFGKFIDRLFQ